MAEGNEDPLGPQYGRWTRSGQRDSWSLEVQGEPRRRGYSLDRVDPDPDDEFGGVAGWDLGGWWDDEPGGLTPQDLADAAAITKAWEQQHG